MTSFLEPAILFHHRWSVPVLAELYRTNGSRFVVLINQLGVGPDSLQHTLKALAKHGWAQRNPGYGHPLRPEYVLTPSGAQLAPACSHLVKLLHSMEIEEVGLRKWSMPVLISVQAGNLRFSDLQSSLTRGPAEKGRTRVSGLPISDSSVGRTLLSALQYGRTKSSSTSPGITARALTMALKDLQTAGLVSRTILDEYPPTARYTLTPQGRKLGRVLDEIGLHRHRKGSPTRRPFGSRLRIVLAPA